MTLTKATPFLGTAEAGRVYDQAMSSQETWRADFTNGEHWIFRAVGEDSAREDARFWADFTRRGLLSVKQVSLATTHK